MASLLHFLGVGVGAVTAAQKTLEEAAACLKLDLTKAGKIAADTVVLRSECEPANRPVEEQHGAKSR